MTRVIFLLRPYGPFHWDGKWPGEADCERLGFFVHGDRSLPDINRLFAECRWNPERQWWEPDLDLPPAGRGH